MEREREEDGQNGGSEKKREGRKTKSPHLRSFKRDKSRLIFDQMTFPTLRELDDTVDTSNEDAQDSQAEKGQEDLEVPLGHGSLDRSAVRLFPLSDSPGVLQAQGDEEGHAGHLETETRHHDVGAEFGVFAAVGFDAGDSAADGLEEETQHVARDENSGICGRSKSGHLRRIELDYVTDGEIDSGGEECRGNS